MKEFNLELAKQGHPVCTREGKPARIICWDRKSDSFPIVALVQKESDTEMCLNYTEDGGYWDGKYAPNCDDLMMVSEKKEGWINIFADGERRNVSCIFGTEEEAKKRQSKYDSYVATIKIEWEE